MKRLKFANNLPEMILSGEKTTSWRINDDKDISVGDELSFCYNNGEEFAKATVLETKLTKFGELNDDDWEGHEKFESKEEMFNTYQKYYGIKITSTTELKVIKFKLK